MNVTLRISLIIALAIYFVFIIRLTKKEKMTLKNFLMWLMVGIFMFIFIIFPTLLEAFAAWLGIVDYLNGLFAIIIFCLIMLLMYLTTLISELDSKIRILIQEHALLEKRVREMEEKY